MPVRINLIDQLLWIAIGRNSEPNRRQLIARWATPSRYARGKWPIQRYSANERSALTTTLASQIHRHLVIANINNMTSNRYLSGVHRERFLTAVKMLPETDTRINELHSFFVTEA